MNLTIDGVEIPIEWLMDYMQTHHKDIVEAFTDVNIYECDEDYYQEVREFDFYTFYKTIGDPEWNQEFLSEWTKEQENK